MPTPYIGPYGETIEAAVNIFTEILDKPGSTDLNVTGQLSIPLKLDQWQLITLCGIGSGTFKLDEDEGAGLEQSAHQLTESLFNERAYRSPEVHSGTNIRELTDSLMVFDHGVCLMETKALAVIETDNSLTADQRKRRTTKDIKKALKQLRGAVRQFRRGASICRSRRGIKGMLNRPGELIELPDRDSVVLGLVLITDLECGLDREDVTAWILNASNPKEIYQVLDLTELRSLVGAAKGPLQFFTNLIVRFAQVQRTQNALIRVSIKSE